MRSIPCGCCLLDNNGILCSWVQWETIDKGPSSGRPLDSPVTSTHDVHESSRANNAHMQPASSERDQFSSMPTTESLVIEASSEFMKQIESTRTKYVSEIEKLKDEMQELRIQKQSFQDDQSKAESSSAEAELQMKQVEFCSMCES